MSKVRPIFLIAGNTITGILRGVVLNVLIALAAVMIIASMSPSSADSPMQMRKTLVDSGLAGITVLGAMIAILTGFTMIPGEIESRTIYPVLARPIRRWQFLLGKFVGAVGINAIVVSFLSALFFVLYFFKQQHSFDGRLPLACFMIFAMLVVLSSLIIFFSTFMSWIGTIIVSMIVWLIGSYSQFFYDLSNFHSDNAISGYAFKIVQKILPNFQAMDMRDIIVNNITTTSASSIEPMQWLLPLGSSCLYGIVALALAILIFNYREV